MSAPRGAALCLDGLVAFDLTAATQVFLAASTADGTPLYAGTSCSPGGEEIATTTGFGLRPPHGLDALESADTIVVPAYFALLDPPPEAARDGVRRAWANRARSVPACSRAF